jgi:hypothetical protein
MAQPLFCLHNPGLFDLFLDGDIGQRFTAAFSDVEAACFARGDMRFFHQELGDVMIDAGSSIGSQRAQARDATAQEQDLGALLRHRHRAVAAVGDHLQAVQALGVAPDAGVDLVVAGAALNEFQRVKFVGSQFLVFHAHFK